MIPFQFADHYPAPREAHIVQVPAKIETKAELFAFLSRSIPLPDYFGHNWDALEECLAEIGERTEPKIALIHQDVPLHNVPADQRIYLEILAAAARDSKCLSVIFPPKWREHITAIIGHHF